MSKAKSVIYCLAFSLPVLSMSYFGGPPAQVERAAIDGKVNVVEHGLEKGLPKKITNSIGMKLRLIPAGSFRMGAVKRDVEAGVDERPRHRVKITKPFYIGECEVTQAQYKAVMKKKPSIFKGAKRPVDYVSWIEAEDFCTKLSKKEKVKYRLPTEAEWEYACRAGEKTKFYWGEANIDKYAWYYLNSGRKTHKVGLKSPNAWHLHDMSGNVIEWCADWYDKNYYSISPQLDPQGPSSGKYRVLRSGRWSSFPRTIRSSFRNWDSPGVRVNGFGFRVVREVK